MSEFERDGRVIKRAAFFAGMAQRVSDGFPDLQKETTFRADSPILLAWVYFLLSDAYKSVRNFPDSLTDDFKKAALSALSVMVVRPFAPLDEDRVDNLTALLANPILALACANAWAADRNLFQNLKHDYLKRFYFTLLNVRIPSLDPFCSAINQNEDYREFTQIGLSHREISVIDDWALKIFMLVKHRM